MEDLKVYVDDVVCSTKKDYTTAISVEHRSNNLKRDFLFVNKLQGKHIPVSPEICLSMFDDLATLVYNGLNGHDKADVSTGIGVSEPVLSVHCNKRILVVGFAETATAIGYAVAKSLKDKGLCCNYCCQTTRECLNTSLKLIDFSEEHSHATSQSLYGDLGEINYETSDFDYVLFVEDEISTGNTILNFIKAFDSVKKNLKYGVASICNWQSPEDSDKFKILGIDTFYILRGGLKDKDKKMTVDMDLSKVKSLDDTIGMSNKLVESDMFARFIFNIGRYLESSREFFYDRQGVQVGLVERDVVCLCELLFNFVMPDKQDNILIIGTEEFMYLPMLMADEIRKKVGCTVSFQATSRSCIDVIKGGGIENRSSLVSPYETYRLSYIYNIKKYDKIIVLNDVEPNSLFTHSLIGALCLGGNKMEDITFITI